MEEIVEANNVVGGTKSSEDFKTGAGSKASVLKSISALTKKKNRTTPSGTSSSNKTDVRGTNTSEKPSIVTIGSSSLS